MPLPRSALRSAFGILITVLAVLTVSCVKIGDAAPELPYLQDPTPIPDRTECEEIQGTAFQSGEERTWYGENCNQWPPVSVPQTPARGSSAARPAVQEPAECAAIRGKPYENEAQRRWYLANCSGNGTQQPAASPTPSPSQGQQGDRTNCDQIRGTPYRSNAERSWYQQTCPSVPSGGTGPDRTNCNEIRGTSYRSTAERDWFQRNCGPGR